MDVDLTLQVVFAGLSIGAIYALVALGFGIVYNATGAINFAQGEYVMLGGVLAGFQYERFGWSLLLIAVVTIVMGMLAGGATEVIGVRFSSTPGPETITIASIGVAVALKGAVTVLTQRRTFGLPGFSGDQPLRIGGAFMHPQLLWNVALVAVAALLLTLFFRHSRRGVAMRAASDDLEMVTVMGMRASTTSTTAFVMAGMLGVIAGLGLTPLTLTSYNAGTLLGLKGFAAAMLGGLGSMRGAVIGGFLLGLSEAGVSGFVASQYSDVVAFVALMVVLFVRPTGIVKTLSVERV